MRYLILILTVLTTTVCQAQSSEPQTQLDEGIKAFKSRDYITAKSKLSTALEGFTANEDVNNVLYTQLNLASAFLHNRESDEAFHIYKQAYKTFDSVTEDSLKVELLYSLSTMYEFKSKYDSVMVLQKECLKYVPDYDEKTKSDVFTLLQRCYLHYGQVDSAMIMIKKAIQIDLARNDSSSIVYNLLDLGNVFGKMGANDSVIYYSTLSLNYLREGKDDYKKAGVFEKISKTFSQIGNYEKALEYISRGLKHAEDVNLTISLERCLIHKGDYLRFLNRFDEALITYKKADSLNAISKKPERKYLINKGIIELDLNLGKAPEKDRLEFIREFLEFTESKLERVRCKLILLEALAYETSDSSEFYTSYDELSIDETLLNDFYLHRTLLRTKKKFEQRNKLWESLAQTVGRLDSVDLLIKAEENSKIVHDIEGKYRKKEQDLEIKGLNLENSFKDRIILISLVALGLISILSFFLFRLYRTVNQQKKVISTALAEKDVLLREIHHRVKNNLQVVSSLLRLQSNSTKDESAQQALKEGQSRVRSMSLIHQNLYGKDNLTGISIEPYMEELAQELVQTYSTDAQVTVETEIENLKLDVDTVVPLGLIINELITNALKHAFIGREKGTLLVQLKAHKDALVLTVKDDGVGMEINDSNEKAKSFGFKLINAFKLKLGADITISSEKGTQVEILIRNYTIMS